MVRKLEKFEEKLKQHDLNTLVKIPTKATNSHTPMLNPKRTAMMTHTQHHPAPSPTHHAHASADANNRSSSPAVESVNSSQSSQRGNAPQGNNSSSAPVFNYDPRSTKDFIKSTYGGNDLGSIATSESSTTYPSSNSKSATSSNVRPLQMRSPRGFVFP